MNTLTLPVHTAGCRIEESVLQALRSYVQEVSQRFALHIDTLEGISIANDFKRFASEFDTGFGQHDRPDVSDLAVGFTAQVLRDGKLGSHIMFPGSIIAAFGCQDESESKDDARYTIGHELTHVDEHQRSGSRFAQELIQLHTKPDPFQVGRRAIWSEYYVCRKVASTHFKMLSEMEETLVRSTEEFSNDCMTARARIAAAKDKARVHGDLCSSAFRFFINAARLLGHLDGIGHKFTKACPIACVYLNDASLAASFEDLHGQLQILWDTFPNWSSLGDLQPILIAIDAVLTKL